MDNSNSGGGRRRVAATHTVEDQALDQIAKEVRKLIELTCVTNVYFGWKPYEKNNK